MKRPDQDLIDMIKQLDTNPTIDEAHRDLLREQTLDAYDRRAQVESQTARNPFSRFKGASFMNVAASIVFLTALGLFTATVLSPQVAFADVARAILEIKSASFDITSEIHHGDGKSEKEGSTRVTTWLPDYLRVESSEGQVAVVDLGKDKMLVMEKEKKTALVYAVFDGDEIDAHLFGAHFFGEIQDHLRRAERSENFGAIRYEKLGEKMIDGTETVGFRVLNPEASEDDEGLWLFAHTLDIWADTSSDRPVRLVFTVEMDEETKETYTFQNFVYNREPEPGLFSLDVPKDYELIDDDQISRIEELLSDKVSLAEDVVTLRDLADALATYAKRMDGRFPPTLDSDEMVDAISEAWEKENPGKPLFAKGDAEYADKELQLAFETLLFASLLVWDLEQQKINYTYTRSGVKVGDKSRPIFWYKSKGAQTYRVIYGDLSIKEASEAPPKPR